MLKNSRNVLFFWREIVFIEIEVWFSVRMNRWSYFSITLHSINPLNGRCPSALRADLRFWVSADPTGHFISSVKRFVNRTVCCSRRSICWSFSPLCCSTCWTCCMFHSRFNNMLCWPLFCHKTILAWNISVTHQSVFIFTAPIHNTSHLMTLEQVQTELPDWFT